MPIVPLLQVRSAVTFPPSLLSLERLQQGLRLRSVLVSVSCLFTGSKHKIAGGAN